MITFENIQEANSLINTTPIKGKDYAEVNQRIKAFRFLYPEGSITTDLISDDGERCVFKATVSNGDVVIGTGTAFELKTSSFINKTSYIENCETSAVGRALAMCGIGIDISVASYEEVANAIENQGDNMQALPNIPEEKEKKTKTKSNVSEKANAYPDRDVMMAIISEKYPPNTQVLQTLLDYLKVDALDKASDDAIKAVYNKCKGK